MDKVGSGLDRSAAVMVAGWILSVMAFMFLAGALDRAWASEPRKVTLAQAVGLARQQSPAVRAARLGHEASVNDIGAALSHLLPHIYAEERYMKTDNPTYAFSSKLSQERFVATDFNVDSLNNPDDIEDFQSSVGFEQALFAPAAYVGVRMARTEAEARGADLSSRQDEAALRAVEAFIGVRTSRAYIEFAQKALEDATEAARIAKLRLDSGLGLYADTLRTASALAEANERLAQAQASNNIARRALALVLGVEGPVDIEDSIALPQVGAIEDYLTAASRRPDLEALALRTQNATNSIRLAQAKYLPTVGVSGAYQYNDHDTIFGAEGENYMIAVQARWDLFDGGLRYSEMRAADNRAKEAQEYLAATKSEIEFKVQEAYINALLAGQSLELAQSREALATEGRRLVLARYEAGLSPLMELLDAQSTLDGARAAVVEKKGGQLKAIARLMYESSVDMQTMNIAEAR